MLAVGESADRVSREGLELSVHVEPSQLLVPSFASVERCESALGVRSSKPTHGGRRYK